MAGSSLRAVYKCMHTESQDGTHPTYNEIFKVMAVSCILPLSNAVCERGFSTLGNIKTAEKSSMLFNKADARMRCVLLGPAMDNRDAVRALVAKATKRVAQAHPPADRGGQAVHHSLGGCCRGGKQ